MRDRVGPRGNTKDSDVSLNASVAAPSVERIVAAEVSSPRYGRVHLQPGHVKAGISNLD